MFLENVMIMTSGVPNRYAVLNEFPGRKELRLLHMDMGFKGYFNSSKIVSKYVCLYVLSVPSVILESEIFSSCFKGDDKHAFRINSLIKIMLGSTCEAGTF